jgi:hypothetical protein
MQRIVILALFLLAACHSGHGDSLAYLDKYAGQSPGAAGIWDTEPLHTKLKDITGDRYDQFVKYMKAAGPLTRDKYLYAIAPVDSGFAYILIDTHTAKLAASIYTKAAIENFQSPGEAFSTPAGVQSQLDSMK